MTLQQIRYVIEISNCGSIGKAAQELNLTQPYLSTTLKDLENELHISIFSRSRKGTALTKEGSEFFRYAKILLEQERQILDLYTQHTAKPPFRVMVSTQRYPFVIKAFCRFMQDYTSAQFEVSLRECSMDCVIRDVFEGKSEIGIIFLSVTTETFIKKYLATRNLEFNEILSTSPSVFFRRGHPMASHEEINLEDMKSYPFASYGSGVSISVDFSEEAILPNDAVLDRRYLVYDRGTMINILTHTDAFSIGTGILSEGFAGPELVSRAIKGHDNEIHLGWIQSVNSQISDEMNVFISKIRDVLGEELSTLRQDVKANY